MSALLLALIVARAPEPTPAPPPDATARVEASLVVVDIVGLDENAFVEELALRLPQRKIIGVREKRPADGFAYVFVARTEGGLRLTLVEPDGSAYDRTYEHEPDEEIRVAASAAATLLFAVEGGAVEPDRTGATVPDPIPPPAEAKVEPEPKSEPPPRNTVAKKSEPPPLVELGPVASAVMGLGLAPSTDAGVFGGGGGALELALRHRGGAVVAASARWLHRHADRLDLDRLRIGVAAGYGWRWSSLELLVLGRIGVEPWWLRRDASAAPLVFAGAPVSRRPLVGGGVIVAPGWFHRARPNIAWRVGPRVELGGSFVPHQGARTIRIDVIDGAGTRAATRLGGLELELGFDLAFWFGLRQAPQ